MHRTRKRELFIRDSRLANTERRMPNGTQSKPQPLDAYELALRCYLAAPSHMTAYALRAADIERMEAARLRVQQGSTVKDVRLSPPKANGQFNVNQFEK